MIELPYLLFIIATLIVTLAIIFSIRIKQGKKYSHDYYNLFIIGIIWTTIGIPLQIYPLSVVGICFLVTGLIHKKEWKKNHKTWNQLDEKTRKIKLGIILFLGILILLGLIFFYLIK